MDAQYKIQQLQSMSIVQGMRFRRTVSLVWRGMDLDKSLLNGLTNGTELGAPKFDKVRTAAAKYHNGQN